VIVLAFMKSKPRVKNTHKITKYWGISSR